MIFIKLEDNMDKFMKDKYKKYPKMIKKMLFKIKCKNGKFISKKINHMEYIILPNLNNRALKRMEHLADIKCWRNICVSNNLLEKDEFQNFAIKKHLRVMDGNWLKKNIVDKIVEYIVDLKNENMENQEIAILCNQLDETIIEKIKELSEKVKICNIFTNRMNQYKKLENDIYQNSGIILNVSNNYKRGATKSNIIINFDFTRRRNK